MVEIARAKSTRGYSRHAIWLVPIALLTLLPLIAMKLLVGGRVAYTEDKLSETQELLLESQERVVDLEKAATSEKRRRLVLEGDLLAVRKERDEHHSQIIKQLHAIGDLKSTQQAEQSRMHARVNELQEKLQAALADSEKLQQQLTQEKNRQNRIVGVKSEELESYHQLIVKQRSEIERKNLIIARFSDDLSRASRSSGDLSRATAPATAGGGSSNTTRTSRHVKHLNRALIEP